MSPSYEISINHSFKKEDPVLYLKSIMMRLDYQPKHIYEVIGPEEGGLMMCAMVADYIFDVSSKTEMRYFNKFLKQIDHWTMTSSAIEQAIQRHRQFSHGVIKKSGSEDAKLANSSTEAALKASKIF